MKNGIKLKNFKLKKKQLPKKKALFLNNFFKQSNNRALFNTHTHTGGGAGARGGQPVIQSTRDTSAPTAASMERSVAFRKRARLYVCHHPHIISRISVLTNPYFYYYQFFFFIVAQPNQNNQNQNITIKPQTKYMMMIHAEADLPSTPPRPPSRAAASKCPPSSASRPGVGNMCVTIIHHP